MMIYEHRFSLLSVLPYLQVEKIVFIVSRRFSYNSQIVRQAAYTLRYPVRHLSI